MATRLSDVRRFWRRLELAERQPPNPPDLPPGRIEHMPGRGEMLVREIPGSPDSPRPCCCTAGRSAPISTGSRCTTPSPGTVVLAIDQRGHGRGLISEQAFTIEAAAADAAALLHHLDAAPATVVGYSLGGSVGLVQCRRHPETVAGLVLQSTGLQWRSGLSERALWAGMASVEYGLRFGSHGG